MIATFAHFIFEKLKLMFRIFRIFSCSKFRRKSFETFVVKVLNISPVKSCKHLIYSAILVSNMYMHIILYLWHFRN